MTPPEPDDDSLRLLEAVIFASGEPVAERALALYLPPGTALAPLLERLRRDYQARGIVLERAGQGWAFRTAPDLAGRLTLEQPRERKLSRAAVETLAIIAYHQPVTRAEIEEIRGVALSKGTLDVLFAAGWIHPRGRRQTPGRPLTWGTTDSFLDHFGLGSLDELPGLAELRAAGLLDLAPGAGAYANRGGLGGPAADLLPEPAATEQDIAALDAFEAGLASEDENERSPPGGRAA
ncbi:SMC-Scp complex subunit ScpB [Phaeospirillum tilakii]|uniref:SMC-Scp complex subunit ScpB n=1 Tax=Phaeospirillum tilakii TaxID=741673 RepID=A0ABW5C640_9PROT